MRSEIVNPIVSVIMPAYNTERFIGPAIKSVLGQSYRNIELIIVDDGSTDNTMRIISEYLKIDNRVRLLRKGANSGIVDTLNFGIENAVGKYIARADSDDVCSPDRFARQIELLERHPNIVIVGSDLEIIDEKGKTIAYRHYPSNQEAVKRTLFFKSPFAHPSVMIRASVLSKRPYNGRFPHAEDYYLWSQLLKIHEGYNLSAPLVKYRISSQQIKNRKLKEQLRSTILVQRLIFRQYKSVPFSARLANYSLGFAYYLPASWIFKLFAWREYRPKQ